MYGTVPTEEVKEASASEEELQKVAELELLAKVAAENGINISELSSEQVTDLLESVKIASDDEEEDEDKKEDKKEMPAFLKKKEDKGDEEEEKPGILFSLEEKEYHHQWGRDEKGQGKHEGGGTFPGRRGAFQESGS